MQTDGGSGLPSTRVSPSVSVPVALRYPPHCLQPADSQARSSRRRERRSISPPSLPHLPPPPPRRRRRSPPLPPPYPALLDGRAPGRSAARRGRWPARVGPAAWREAADVSLSPPVASELRCCAAPAAVAAICFHLCC